MRKTCMGKKGKREEGEKGTSRSALTTRHLLQRYGRNDGANSLQPPGPPTGHYLAGPKGEALQPVCLFSPLPLHAHTATLSWGFGFWFWFLKKRKTEVCLCHTNTTICSSFSAVTGLQAAPNRTQGMGTGPTWGDFLASLPFLALINLEAKLNYLPRTWMLYKLCMFV